MKTKHLLFSVLVLTSTNISAQNRFQFNVHVAPAVGDFGAGKAVGGYNYNGSINAGVPNSFAGTGLGVGVEYHLPIGAKGFHIFGALDAYWNRIKGSVRKEHELDNGDYLSIDHPDFFNLPLQLGPHYEYAFNDNIGMFVQLGLAGDLLLISKAGWTEPINNIYSWTYERHFSPSFSLGFTTSAGVVIKKKYVVGIGYKSLGNHVFVKSGSKSSPMEITTSTETIVKKVALFDLTLAIRI